ncbi:MAG: M60 family metallopeptidase [Gammaproteobacteria bacterium]|nr:M60 family metallopeptidase [Gammaproteobacteria bacterium]
MLELLEGVGEVDDPAAEWEGGAQALCVYGADAEPVVAGSKGAEVAPLVALGRWGEGRLVVFGDDDYFRSETLDAADNGMMMLNAFAWAADGSPHSIGAVRDDDYGRNLKVGELRDWLDREGYSTTRVEPAAGSLAAVDVVFTIMHGDRGEDEIAALQSFVESGGGLVVAAEGWIWQQDHPQRSLVEDFAGNRLLRDAGIQWRGTRLVRDPAEHIVIDGPPDPMAHAGKALDALVEHAAGTQLPLGEQDLLIAIKSVERAIQCLPAEDDTFVRRLDAILEQDARWPTGDRPVGLDDPMARFAALVVSLRHERTPAERVRPHAAAADFPGAVPAQAPRITRRFELELTGDPEPVQRGVYRNHNQGRRALARWHSTGLYAAPGEQVVVTVPAGVADTGLLFVQVGIHDLDLWMANEWRRMPAMTRRFAITQPTTSVANAFGGLIYVQSPFEVELGRVTVEVEGAVAAPRFVLGETDPVAWRDEIRSAPGPWAEIEGRNMIVTTVSEEVRHLDDPGAVAEVWDEVADLNAELAAWVEPDERVMRERFVVDRQLPYGGMLAGYPLRAHLDQQGHLVDALFLRTCRKDWRGSGGSVWGMYHEVGHNHQSRHWTFDETVEVTVNLFTLYVHERLCGIGVDEVDWFPGPSEQLRRHDFKHQHLPPWKREPSLGLHMYVQLQREFGWEAFRQTFAEYLNLPEEELPADDDGKRDQWLTRFSRTVGRNLAPFFEAWGVSTSREAKEEVAGLPAWLPPASGFPIRPVARLGDLDDDGNDDVVLRHLDGRWHYYPMNGRQHVAAGRGAADLPLEAGWSFAGIGDFDGVEGDEVLLRHEDGRWRRHPMNGRRQRDDPAELALPPSPDWRLAAVGDFDGDGSDDVLLRHVGGHWLLQPMRDGVPADGADEERIVVGLDYRLEGVGDFDGDGKDDLLLRHVEGRWSYHHTDGRDAVDGQIATELPDDQAWRLAGVGDFDGDGNADVLLRHWETRRWAYYRSAERTRSGSGVVHLTRNPRYGVAGIGDLDGDGRDDVLLRRDDGVWYYYAMEGRRAKDRGGANLTRDVAWEMAR